MPGVTAALMSPPRPRTYQLRLRCASQQTLGANVRFGSKADICAATSDDRFTPNSDHESGHPQTVMSALPPKADMCSALAHVCFEPIADIGAILTVAWMFWRASAPD